MSYGRAILFRWSRRDRLAAVVVAVAVASLVGTAVLVVAAGAQTAAIADQYADTARVEYHDSAAAARSAAGDGDAIVAVARVDRPGGGEGVAVGVPADPPDVGDRPLRARAAGEVTRGGIADPRTVELAGDRTTLAVRVTPREAGATVFPTDWYVTDAATVERLGPTGAFVIGPDGGAGPPADAPLLSALAFFRLGTEQALRALAATAVGSALLVGVTVYSVTRMSVRDRLTAIRVARSTGATPRRVLSLFAARATLLTAVGVALGYAVGVIVPNAAVNAAVALGVRVALPIRVTAEAARVLVPLLAGTVAVGAVAGAVGAAPAVRRPPGRLEATPGGRSDRRRFPRLPRPALVGWRALVPTAATLAAFVTFVVVLSALAGAVQPMVAADGAVVTEPGSEHPASSRVPVGHAATLQERGIDASPEILLFEVAGGNPFLARGANYSAFASVTDARIADGRRPRAPDEAVAGTGLARALGVGVGDRITLGGSTAPAVARVEIVGTFDAPNPYDDQLLTSLPLARHLANVDSSDAVHLVRAERLPEGSAPTDRPVAVAAVSAPGTVPSEGSVEVGVTVRNAASEGRTATVAVGLGDRTRRVRIDVPAGERRTVRVNLSTAGVAPGRYQLRAGDASRAVRVVPPDALFVRGLPDRAPPGSAPLVRVETAANDPVAGATVAVDGRAAATTDASGRARVPLDGPGERELTVRAGDRTANASVAVREGADRRLVGTLRVSPATSTVLSVPTARASLYNPWNSTVERAVAVVGPGRSAERTVALGPGERTTVAVDLPRRSPGSYRVAARAGGRTLAEATYEVTGDDRIASTLASGGRSGTTGIGEAMAVAFGNIWVVLATVLGLAGLMTVGGTTASFAQSIHARRRSIGIRLATGATRRRVLGLVVRDALLVGAAASAVALAVGLLIVRALDALGYLTVFGVDLSTVPDPPILAAVVAASVALTVLGATVTLLGVFATPLTALLEERPPARAGGGDRE